MKFPGWNNFFLKFRIEYESDSHVIFHSKNFNGIIRFFGQSEWTLQFFFLFFFCSFQIHYNHKICNKNFCGKVTNRWYPYWFRFHVCISAMAVLQQQHFLKNIIRTKKTIETNERTNEHLCKYWCLDLNDVSNYIWVRLSTIAVAVHVPQLPDKTHHTYCYMLYAVVFVRLLCITPPINVLIHVNKISSHNCQAQHSNANIEMKLNF